MKSGVYIIKNKITGDVYVGSSSNPITRWNQHKYVLRHKSGRNPLLQEAWDKYGEDAFELKILALVPEDQLLIVEQQLIDGFKPAYNISLEIGKFPPSWEEYRKTPEYKERVSRSVRKLWKNPEYRERCLPKNNWKNGKSSNRLGAKLSDETKEKLRQANLGSNNPNYGKHRSKESRNKLAKTYIGVISPDGIIYSPIINLRDFCSRHSLDTGSMSRLLNGKINAYKGWIRFAK